MAKTRSTKRALLLSALAILMCVSMLVGSTFAWFTDSVTSARNQIVSGNLDVVLYYSTWDSTTNTWSDYAEVNANTKIFDENALYEPGYTEVVRFKVENAGSLALKYNMTATIYKEEAGINVYNEPFNLSEYIYTGKVDVATITDRATAAAQATEKLGTGLNMAAGTSLLPGASEEFALVLTMPTTVGNEANHLKGHQPSIEFGIALVATQFTYEEDDFGPDYDKMATVDDLAELAEALAGDYDLIVLGANLVVDETIEIPAGKTVTIDLAGCAISSEKAYLTTAYAVITNNGDLTIMDSLGNGKISFTDATPYTSDIGWASNTIKNLGTLTVNSGIIENNTSAEVMNFSYPHAIDAYQGSVTTINGGTVKSLNYDSIRMFCNSETLATTVNINGGTIINRVSFQDPAASRAGYGILNITGGEFVTTNGVTANVRLLNFSNVSGNMKATVTGGTFDAGFKTQDIVNAGVKTSDWLTIFSAVNDVDDLADALANGNSVVLNNDIVLDSTLMTTNDAVIDLNGNTITAPASGNMFQSQSNAAPDITITSSTAGAEINVTGGDTAVVLGYGSTVISNVTINVTGCDNYSPNPFKVYGDLTLGEGTVVNVDYLGTALISNNGAVEVVIDGAEINIGTFKTNGTAIITLNQASTLEMKNTTMTIDNFVLSAFGGDSLVSKVDGVTVDGCTFDVTDSNGASCTFEAKNGKYRLVQE